MDSRNKNDNVQSVSSMLKNDGLMNIHRIIRHKRSYRKRPDFLASRFKKQIYYYGDCSSLSRDELIFSLLHEESHLNDSQNGNILAIIWLVCFSSGLSTLLLIMFGILEFTSFNFTIFFILMILPLIMMILFRKNLEYDEIQADNHAALLLQTKYGIDNPSIIVEKVLNKTPHRSVKSTLFDRLFDRTLNTHPSIIKRVSLVREKVDVIKQ